MPRQVLFIQGGGPGTHDDWDARLVESLGRLLGDGFEVRYPRMPAEDDPNPERWGPAIADALAALEPGAIVVGHSVGGTLLVHVLAAAGAPACAALAGIVLISVPFVGDGGWSDDGFSLPAGLGDRLPRGASVELFHGLSDDEVPPAHVDLFAAAIPSARVHRLPGRDHQLGNNLSEVAAVIREITQRGES
jgi:predicted alpha/beta hydrolase family esterase